VGVIDPAPNLHPSRATPPSARPAIHKPNATIGQLTRVGSHHKILRCIFSISPRIASQSGDPPFSTPCHSQAKRDNWSAHAGRFTSQILRSIFSISPRIASQSGDPPFSAPCHLHSSARVPSFTRIGGLCPRCLVIVVIIMISTTITITIITITHHPSHSSSSSFSYDPPSPGPLSRTSMTKLPARRSPLENS
jgi:hypothetical protein